MTPVDQTDIGRGTGDCMRAMYASLLDLELSQVPHFILYKDDWFRVLQFWLNAVRWAYVGYRRFKPGGDLVPNYEGVNGYYAASVPSRTHPNGKTTHAVILDAQGVVVHDPNPNKLWQGANPFEDGTLLGVDIILPLGVSK